MKIKSDQQRIDELRQIEKYKNISDEEALIIVEDLKTLAQIIVGNAMNDQVEKREEKPQ